MIKGIFRRFAEQRQVIGKFRQAGAFSIDLAKSLPELELNDTPVLRKLVRQGIIIHAGLKTYFLDEKQLMQYRLSRVKWAIIVLFFIIIILLWRIPRIQ